MDSKILLNKGFSPLPVPEGQKYPRGFDGWPKVTDWHGDAPGLGLNLVGLAMIDFDVKLPLGAETENWVAELAAEINPEAPMRWRRGSPSAALLVRCSDIGLESAYLSTAKLKDDNVEARVEIKVGQGHFMFGWGTHPHGAPLQWALQGGSFTSPADFPAVGHLPEMTLAQLVDAANRLDQALKARFPDTPVTQGHAHRGWVSKHDLRWDMTFTLPGGGEATLYELWAQVRDGAEDAAWVNLTPFRPDSDSGAGHLVACTVHPGYPAIFDFARYVHHFFDLEHELSHLEDVELPLEMVGGSSLGEVALEVAARDQDVARVEATHRLIYVRESGKLVYRDDPEGSLMSDRAAFHGFSAKERAELLKEVPAVQRLIWDPELPPLSTVRNARRQWDEHNLFAFPQHAEYGGDLAGFFSWFEGFIPDPVERDTIIQWLAHKVRSPHDRMFTVVLVGPEGGGKGTFWKVLDKLWGHHMVSMVGSVQALYDGRYQDALYRTLWVLVDEVSSEDMARIGRKTAHERLKTFCEPQAAHKLLNIKGQNQISSKVCASVGIATNNINALPISATDRRFFVASTGPEMSRRDVEAIHAWLSSPENVSALWRYLAGRTKDPDFNAMRAPDSQSKSDMASTGLTDIDAVMADLVKRVVECGGVCTASQAYEIMGYSDLDHEDRTQFRRMFRGAFPVRLFQAEGTSFKGRILSRTTKAISGREAYSSVMRVTEMIKTLADRATSRSEIL